MYIIDETIERLRYNKVNNQISFHTEKALESLEMSISFEEAVMLFYHSEIYKILQETENTLWVESAEYIVDRYLDEREASVGTD